jgi:prolyl-tRNA synthetase
MRYSKLFGHTTKNITRDAVVASHRLLLQAGFIKESTAGKYYFLPLGWRVHEKIKAIIKEEMDAAGAQEMLSPVLHPLELWQETNRTSTTGFELLKVKDRNNKEFALGGTAEEMFTDLVRRMNLTHKDLPLNIYQFSTKFRDELRPRGGLLRVREFIMKDAYSFDKNEEEFKKTYELMKKTYTKIFERFGLKTVVVESDNGYIGGEYCHEFVVESDAGESRFFVEESSASSSPTPSTPSIPPVTYAAHEEVCHFSRDYDSTGSPLNIPVNSSKLPLSEIDAPRGPKMTDGEKFHKVAPWQQLKTVAYVNEKQEFILACIRGDLQINEIKLAHQTGSITLRPATDDEIIKQLNSYPGFLSPVSLTSLTSQTTPIHVVADLSVPKMINFVTGANSEHRDLINANYDRDFKAEKVCDIGKVFEGAVSENGKKLIAKKGIEVGNIFQLGYHYTNLMKGAEFVNENGMMQKFYMGCYGIGLGRNLQTIAEIYHDEKGILWPEVVAPYRFHLITLTSPNSPTTLKIQDIAFQLQEKLGDDLLWDDRPDVSAGAKFADADLIGCPIRIVISEKTNGKIEIKNRAEKETKLMEVEEFLKTALIPPH